MNSENVSLTGTFVSFLKDQPPTKQLENAIAEIDLIGRLDSGVFDEIPFISTLVAMVRSAKNIQAHFLLKKLLRFFAASSDISEVERAETVNRMNTDEDYRRRITDELIVLLDRFDHLDKAYMLGKLYVGLVQKRVDEESFWRLGAAINRAYVGDLHHLLRQYSDFYYVLAPWERLHASGLARLKVDVTRVTEFQLIEEVTVEYESNGDASLLAKLVLGEEFQPWLELDRKDGR